MKAGNDPEYSRHPFESRWLPGRHDLRTTDPVISIGYEAKKRKNISAREKARMNCPQKHIIHKDFLWKKMLDEGKVGALNEIAAKEGVPRAGVTQIMNLLKLPPEMREFLLGLDEPKEIRKHSERRPQSMKESSLTGMM